MRDLTEFDLNSTLDAQIYDFTKIQCKFMKLSYCLHKSIKLDEIKQMDCSFMDSSFSLNEIYGSWLLGDL